MCWRDLPQAAVFLMHTHTHMTSAIERCNTYYCSDPTVGETKNPNTKNPNTVPCLACPRRIHVLGKIITPVNIRMV